MRYTVSEYGSNCASMVPDFTSSVEDTGAMAFGWSKVFSVFRSGLWRVVTLAVPDVFMPCNLIWAGLALGCS